MKIQTLAILTFAASLFAQEASVPAPESAPATAPEPVAAAVQEELLSCEASFNAVKDSYPKDAATNRIYAMINGRMKVLRDVEKDKRNGAIYEAELKSCELAVELFKIQQSNATLRKSLDSLNQRNFAVQKEISIVKDSLINLWASDAAGAKSLNAALSDERNRLEKLNKEKEKALAEKDSLLARQKAEADKKLEALRSKTISVYKDARGTILSMSDILFEFGKADLKQELKENLAEIAAILKSLLTESKVDIEGHTDNVGSAASNKKLSEQRAKAVLDYLVDRGVDKKRLKAKGFGFEVPVADNKTKEGQAKNRRVELVIKD
jgi:outer membrane protein OmpA-like peptidoglycan-associated protein